MSVVDAVAIEAVIEAQADCSDRERAQAALAAALTSARGPRRMSKGEGRWHLDMRVTSAAPGIKAADAKIRDDGGRVVAERTVSDKTSGTCVPLARAVSAWAQIVLDDELVRAHDEESTRHPDPAPPESRPIVMTTSSSSLTNKLGPGRARSATDSDDSPSPFATDESEIPTGRTFEVGTMLFLRNGAAATGGIFGVAPFATMTFAERWVVRPSLAIGTSTSRVPPDQANNENLRSFGGRIDLCRRMPGNYIDHRGIEFDACAGGDTTYVWSDLKEAVRASIGPSAIFRGEIGQNFGLEIRSIVGVNLARDGRGMGADLPPFVVALELGASVRFR